MREKVCNIRGCREIAPNIIICCMWFIINFVANLLHYYTIKEMKNLIVRGFVLIMSAFALVSCGVRLVPQTFDYPVQKTKKTLDLSFDKTWSGVVDFFAENNIPIKTIEKSSGLIVSTQMEFPATYWITSEKRLYDPNAYIAVQQVSGLKIDGTGMRATATWNVRVKAISEDKTEIQVNIATPLVELLLLNANTYRYEWTASICEARSTGMLDKHLSEYILSR